MMIKHKPLELINSLKNLMLLSIDDENQTGLIIFLLNKNALLKLNLYEF